MKDSRMDAKKNALIRPLLEYAAPAWSSHLHRDIDILEKVQKRAARYVGLWNQFGYTTSTLFPFLL